MLSDPESPDFHPDTPDIRSGVSGPKPGLSGHFVTNRVLSFNILDTPIHPLWTFLDPLTHPAVYLESWTARHGPLRHGSRSCKCQHTSLGTARSTIVSCWTDQRTWRTNSLSFTFTMHASSSPPHPHTHRVPLLGCIFIYSNNTSTEH